MKKFKVAITETLERIIEVEAETAQEAAEQVEESWSNSEINLDANDFTHLRIDAEEIEEEEE